MLKEVCELCVRSPNRTMVHHLIPKQCGGVNGPSMKVCSACHKQIHAIFTNKELAEFYHSKERLLDHPEMAKYIKWVIKQDPEKRITTRKSNSRRR